MPPETPSTAPLRWSVWRTLLRIDATMDVISASGSIDSSSFASTMGIPPFGGVFVAAPAVYRSSVSFLTSL